ncbi:MAG TPA: glycosyltransferase family 2 protein [Thermomicrobiales bacterium]|nr:glycosyltransferase family 2 protein [Thermomicrobiales bacterium]
MLDRASSIGSTTSALEGGLGRPSVTVVLPCLDEAAAIAAVVAEAWLGLRLAGVDGDVVVVDNGSGDGSGDLARQAGARVVPQSRRGYGAAIAAGIRAARGEIVVVADADGSYDLTRIGDLLAVLAAGADLAIGSRFGPALAPGAMPSLHRYLGTPALTNVLRLLTGSRIIDSQSGFRAFRRAPIATLGVRSPGMEFASELLLRAERDGWIVVETPVGYRPRLGESKLAPFADGWRHLRLLLLLSPQLSLLLPSAIAIVVGALFCALSLVAPQGVWLGPLRWLPVFLGPMLLILGGQAGLLGLLAAHRSPLAPPGLRHRLDWLGRPGGVWRLLAICAVVAALGAALDVLLLVLWLGGRSGPQLLGLAGLAQAAIVFGLGGIATLLAVEFARDSLLD